MSTAQCEHSAGSNPRKQDTCVKCGRPIEGRWRRDIEREAELIQRAAGPNDDVSDLVALSIARSGTGAVRSLRTRNFFIEVREELSDAANYLCWLDDQRVLGGEDGLRNNELIALHHVAQAWRWLHSRGQD